MKNIMVSIYCLTYNHVGIIEKCIQGFLNQKTDFDYEIVIHDDASDDGTKEILQKYEIAYPDKFRIIYEEKNQYSQGNDISKIVRPYLKGKYIAICEGDDYWTDSNKLKLQVNILEKNPDISLCVCAGEEINLKNSERISIPRESEEDNHFVTMERCIEVGGAYFPTSSFVIRNDFNPFERKWGNGISVDYSILLLSAMHGRVYYLNSCMLMKTLYYPGSWSDQHFADENVMQKFRIEALKSHIILKQDLSRRYHKIIEDRIEMLQREIVSGWKPYLKVEMGNYYTEFWESLSLKFKLIMFVRRFCPIVLDLYRKIRKRQ